MLRTQRLLAAVLAIVLPALVLGWGYHRLQRPARATGKAADFDRKLRVFPPKVLVLGSSLARTDVQIDVLADELGIPRKRVVMLTLPNSTAAHWYAILKNRVFARGYEPELVLMVGALTTFVTPDILYDANVDRLVNQLSGEEPIIARKVFGADAMGEFQFLYMRERASAMREELLEGWRDRALSLVVSEKGGPGHARRLAERSNELVFSDAAMNYELHKLDATGLDSLEAVDSLDREDIDVAVESLLPDIGELAAAHGARVVYVRTPFPPSNAENDRVPPDIEAQALSVMEEAGAGYLDMRSLNLDDSYYQDMRHMGRQGAVIFTRTVARALTDMGVLSRRGSVRVDAGLTPARFERLGEGPAAPDLSLAEPAPGCGWTLPAPDWAPVSTEALDRAGHPGASPVVVRSEGLEVARADRTDGCEGSLNFEEGELQLRYDGSLEGFELGLSDATEIAREDTLPATWVYPGTSLELTFDEPWPYEDETFEVFALAATFGATGVPPVLEVAGRSTPFETFGQRAWQAVDPPAPRGGPWTLRISSPPDGPWLLIQNLAVGAAPHTAHVVGFAELINGASIRLVGGNSDDTELDPHFATELPALQVGGRVRRAPRSVGLFALPGFADLADAPNSAAGMAHKCSPLRVFEDGVPLENPHASCLEMANLKHGRTCHAGNVLFFSASDETHPADNGRTYSLGLEPSRLCERRNQMDSTPLRDIIWLYPGDEVSFAFPADKLGRFYDGANKLEIETEGFLLGDGDRLELTLEVAGEPYLRQVLEDHGERRKVTEWLFEPSLPPRTDDIRLTVRSLAERGYFLLVMATLAEEYDYGFGLARRSKQAKVLGSDDRVEAAPEELAEAAPAVHLPEGEASEGIRRSADRVRRLGTVPDVPQLKDVQPSNERMMEGTAFGLWPVSNSVLQNKGLGWWSPVQLLSGGDPLVGALNRKSFRKDCSGCFIHFGQSVVWIPRKNDPGPVTLRLDPRFPVPTVSGERVHWIYPGMGAAFEFDEPWTGDAVRVRAVVAVYATEKFRGVGPRLRVAGEDVPFSPDGDLLSAEITLARGGAGPWSIDISSGGAYLLLHDLEFVDATGTNLLVRTPHPVEEPVKKGGG